MGDTLQPTPSIQLTLPSNPMPVTQGGSSVSQPGTPVAPQEERPSTQQPISNQPPVDNQQELPLPNQEIPGFLYDRETNRYYRITSNPAQSPSGVSLANKAKSKAKLNNDHKKTKSPVDGAHIPVTIEMSHSPLVEKLRWPRNNVSVDMTKLLILREYQQLGLAQSKRLVYTNIPKLLDTKSPVILSLFGEIKAVAINPAGTLMATYGEGDHTLCYLRCLNNLWTKYDAPLFNHYRAAVHAQNPINDIQFVSLGGKEVLAYSSFASRGGGVKVINTPSDRSTDEDLDEYYPIAFFKWNNCFSFTWNSHRNLICLGGHKGICVRSIEVDQYSKYIHTNSHVLSTQLGTVTPYIACGTRRGEILLWDSRNVDDNSMPIINLQVHGRIGNSVTCLNMLRDENYLISTSANGRVLQWDLRMSRVVLPFSHGVRDELTFNYTKSVIGGEETLIFTATQSSINVWSLLNGCKVQTIPVTMSDEHQQSPVMCYTNNFSGDGHYTSALIASIGSMLKAFTFKNFYPEKYLTIMKCW